MEVFSGGPSFDMCHYCSGMGGRRWEVGGVCGFIIGILLLCFITFTLFSLYFYSIAIVSHLEMAVLAVKERGKCNKQTNK